MSLGRQKGHGGPKGSGGGHGAGLQPGPAPWISTTKSKALRRAQQEQLEAAEERLRVRRERVREAQARGLEVEAWINVMPLWRGEDLPRDPTHPYLQHPEGVQRLRPRDQPEHLTENLGLFEGRLREAAVRVTRFRRRRSSSTRRRRPTWSAAT